MLELEEATKVATGVQKWELKLFLGNSELVDLLHIRLTFSINR